MKSEKLDIHYLVRALLKYRASDLHLKVGRPPLFRVNGQLVASKLPELTFESLQEVVAAILSVRHQEALERDRQVDFSFRIQEMGRFRANLYYQRDSLAAAIRRIPLEVPELSRLGLPHSLKDLCQKQSGLVLITGSTGSGKSTTLAAMIQEINESRSAHVLCLEDPIEFIFKDLKSTISQREIGTDVADFESALRSGLRQDPDVIMIGELRDLQTIRLALTASETGHLVFATLHTSSAATSIERILEAFPADLQSQARSQLAHSLLAIVSQKLINHLHQPVRVAATEILVKSPSIEGLILQNQNDAIEAMMEKSQDYYGMQTLNQSLAELVKSKKISQEAALKASNKPEDLKLRLSGMTRDSGYEAVASSFDGRNRLKLTG